MNQDVRDAITNNLRRDHLRHLVYKKSDTITLLQDGLQKVADGITCFDEILRLIDIDNDFIGDEGEENVLKSTLLGKTQPQTNSTPPKSTNESPDYEVLSF
jgi:hypothetical protein